MSLFFLACRIIRLAYVTLRAAAGIMIVSHPVWHEQCVGVHAESPGERHQIIDIDTPGSILDLVDCCRRQRSACRRETRQLGLAESQAFPQAPNVRSYLLACRAELDTPLGSWLHNADAIAYCR